MEKGPNALSNFKLLYGPEILTKRKTSPNALSNFKVCFHYCPNLNFKTKALKEKTLK
ncbi:hypothetical protein BLOT_014421, partial [Blomia tropicalis]